MLDLQRYPFKRCLFMRYLGFFFFLLFIFIYGFSEKVTCAFLALSNNGDIIRTEHFLGQKNDVLFKI